MAKRYQRKLAVLAKIETVYGTDPVPTGEANAILCTDVKFEPLAADVISRNLYQSYFGAQQTMLAAEHVTMSFKVELAGSGTPGVAPGWGPLMRACACAETITEDTDVVYTPVSGAFESVTQYFNLDGVLHKFLGARGNVKATLAPKAIPYLDYSFTGLLVPAVDAALPSQTLTAFQQPLPVSKTNTPVFSMHGYSAIAESFELDFGNQVELRNLIGEDSVQIVDRQSSGSMVIEAASIATKDWFAIARARTRGALAVQHGTVNGNIVEIAGPKLQINAPSYGETQGIVNITLPFAPIPDTGNDEWSITVR